MPHSLLPIFTLTLLFCSCYIKNKVDKKPIQETFDCPTGLMKPAWYVHGVDESIPNIKNLKQDFIVLVDTNLKATNIISFHEDFSREQAKTLDTSDYILKGEEWNRMTSNQKLAKVAERRHSNKQEADSEHIKNNNGQNKIWIINNTNDTISIQMQDWSYICVLQGLTKSGKWQPIQYWRFSTCGISYYDKHFLPKTANSFITILPNKGDFETRLRFKFL